MPGLYILLIMYCADASEMFVGKEQRQSSKEPLSTTRDIIYP